MHFHLSPSIWANVSTRNSVNTNKNGEYSNATKKSQIPLKPGVVILSCIAMKIKTNTHKKKKKETKNKQTN